MPISPLKQQFLNALKRGTGEAYLIVRDNPSIDFSNQIIKGALNHYAYDGQSEGVRAQYIFDIIAISKQKDKIRKAVLQGLANEKDNTWNLTHLFAIAKLFAEQNDAEAKQAIRDRFLNHTIDRSYWEGSYEILALDGLDGLFYIAEKYGKYIEQNPDAYQDDYIIQHFQDENPNISAYEALETKAQTNRHIRIYLDNIKATKARQEERRSQKTAYKDIIDETLNRSPFTIAYNRKRNLNTEEVNQIAQHLIKETDNSNIEKLLDIFRYHKFPYDSQIILDFAKRKPSRKNRLVEFAIDALQYLQSDNIRQFAMDKIASTKHPVEYLNILISNYQPGDGELLSKIAKQTNDEHKIEHLAGVYNPIYMANKTTECKEPLEILYSKMNCGIHRCGVVEILLENNVLSDKIRNEIQFDSYLKTRQLLD